MSLTLDQHILALVQGQANFDEVVRAVFAHQLERSPAYRRACERAGITEPEALTDWRQVPTLPVDAFKRLDLRCFPPERTVATFHTSGTTTGTHGAHHFDDLRLYKQAALTAFGPALVPEGGRIRVVSLIEGADAVPDSSLSQMVTWVIEAFGTPDSVIDPTGAALEGASEPLLVLGTAFGLANVLEARPALRLPEGTRIMETGGFKGRRRALTRGDLLAMYDRAGVRPASVVGEYGMTELSSQWYDAVAGVAGPRVYRPPAWARTRVLDPVALTDVAPGEVGLLQHLDPVNRGSVQAILTADLGERVVLDDGRDGFIYRGRATGARIRGCSLRDEG